MARVSCTPLLSLFVSLATGSAALAATPSNTLEGTIRKFECGDNCYLMIADKAGREHTGLCTAPECAKWNETAMPARYKGKRVSVTLGQGVQRDGDGHVMGRMTAFTKICFGR